MANSSAANANDTRGRTAALPWLLGLAGLLVYLFTLSRGVSILQLGLLARLEGWLWQPELYQPLTAAVLFPFRFLPPAKLAPALNFFAALCAAAVLAFLAKSVLTFGQQLSRHTSEPSRTSRFWFAPCLAVAICGLELSFWERATVITGEMIDLLVFSAVILCLVQFRGSRGRLWLPGSALLYGAGMANHWAFTACAPIYLAGLVWLKGRRFFRPRFLIAMAVCCLAGLSLFLLLPVVESFSPGPRVGFWPALKANLRFQAGGLRAFPRTPWILAGLVCWGQLLAMWLRRNSTLSGWGGGAATGGPFARWGGQALAAMALCFSIYLAFDPAFGPRHSPMGAPALLVYYLAALMGGCSASYLLTGGATDARPAFQRRRARRHLWTDRGLPIALGGIALVLPLALVWKNLEQIRASNGPVLGHFADAWFESLPAGKSVVFSDDLQELLLFEAELPRHPDKEALPLDATSLASPAYQEFLATRFKARWPKLVSANGTVAGPSQLGLALANQEPVFYLNPSVSSLQEVLRPQPHCAVQELSTRKPGAPLEIAINPSTIEEQNRFWQKHWPGEMAALVGHSSSETNSTGGHSRLQRFAPPRERSLTLQFLAHAYAKRLDAWGVGLQRSGRWPEAGSWFERALQLYPDNLSARINLKYNRNYQRGDRRPLDRHLVMEELPELFRPDFTWEAACNRNGPVDEPRFLFETALWFQHRQSHFQAATELSRCLELAPDWPAPALRLAWSLLSLLDFGGALRATDRIDLAHLEPSEMHHLLYCRGSALLHLGRTNDLLACLNSFVAKYPGLDEVKLMAAELYADAEHFDESLALLDGLAGPDKNPQALLAKRGEVRRRAGRFDAANADFQELLKRSPDSPSAYLGLGDVAAEIGRSSKAVKLFEQGLEASPHASVERAIFAERLKQLGTNISHH